MADSPERLFERHHLAVYRYLLRMTCRHDVAEDLTQEVFLRVLRGLSGYDDRGLERPWLISIARNLMIDRCRRAEREPSFVVEDISSGGADHAMSLEIRQAMSRLPEEEREAFVLRVVVGLGHEEIAGVVGATAAAVRCRIYRARIALRSLL